MAISRELHFNFMDIMLIYWGVEGGQATGRGGGDRYKNGHV